MKKVFALMAMACVSMMANAQFPQRTPTPNDTLKSVTVNADKSVTFRIYAPGAKTVTLGGDLAGYGDIIPAPKFVKQANGVWEAKANTVNPNGGTYRYNFVVDGVRVNDPKAAATADLTAVVNIDPEGDGFWSMKENVPHGAVATVYYKSSTFNNTRRCHVWTPAGYEKGNQKLPVLYLIHGGGDNDYAWPNVGSAGNILDNLLAEGKMVPMVVVMPNGSVNTDLFTDDMMNDLIPYVESHYNVYTDKDHRALAGLSMGGLETLNVSLLHYNSFAYVMNKSFKIYKFYMGGEEDIAYQNCIATREAFTKAGVKHEYSSMPGGHTWHVWRHNLHDFAPLLFK